MKAAKRYDQAYFDKWYRGRDRVHASGEVRRKVAMAVSTAEYFLHRSIRSVLDVGCGEAAWLPHLRALRPRVRYVGLDPSDYAVKRFGKRRNIRKATFGELPSLQLDGPFDLIICSDVLHYVADSEIRAGVAVLARQLEGVAFLEVLTKEDDIVGDLDALIRRPAAWYRRTFAEAGLDQVGPYCWSGPAMVGAVAELEHLG